MSKVEGRFNNSKQVFPVEGEQRDNGPQLDDDKEGEHRIICRDIENPLRDEQMRSGGDWDKFGQPLDDAEEEGMKKSHVISMPAIQ